MSNQFHTGFLFSPMVAHQGHLSTEAVGFYQKKTFYEIQFRYCDMDAEGPIFFTLKIGLPHLKWWNY